MPSTPWWFPVMCDAAYFARLREDYPDNAHMSDEELHAHYNESAKYQNLWDHTGDAYEQFEKVADDYLRLRAEIEKAVRGIRGELQDQTQGTAETFGKIDMRIDELATCLDLAKDR